MYPTCFIREIKGLDSSILNQLTIFQIIVAVGSIIAIIGAFVGFINYLGRPRPRFAVEMIQYQKNHKKPSLIEIEIKNTGEIAAEYTNFLVEIENRFFEVLSDMQYRHPNEKGRIHFKEIPNWPPGEILKRNIKVKKKRSGKMKLKIYLTPQNVSSWRSWKKSYSINVDC